MVHQFSVLYLLPAQKSDLLSQFQSKNILRKGFTWPSLNEVDKPGAITWGHGMNVTSRQECHLPREQFGWDGCGDSSTGLVNVR